MQSLVGARGPRAVNQTIRSRQGSTPGCRRVPETVKYRGAINLSRPLAQGSPIQENVPVMWREHTYRVENFAYQIKRGQVRTTCGLRLEPVGPGICRVLSPNMRGKHELSYAP